MSDRVAEATCQILIENEQGVLSAGSGILIEGNRILTAKHVLARRNGSPYKGALAIRGDGFIHRGNASFQAPNIDIGMAQFIRAIPIDLAQLVLDTTLPGGKPLPLATEISPRGTEVLIAGFTDDVPMPLDFDDYLETMNPDMTEVKKVMETRQRFYMRPLMVKRALIGSVQPVTINEDHPTKEVRGASYILDNDLTYGGSGGPVVNMDGELVAIITRKAVTNAEELRIRSIDEGGVRMVDRLFSGSGLALSHHLEPIRKGSHRP